MNKARLLFLSLLFVFAFSISPADANAQCVQCSTQGRKFICAPSSSGGRGCVTNSAGTSCGVSSPCGSGRIASQVDYRQISLSENFVGDIKMTAPHLAAALAFISKNKELLVDGYATIYLMPSEMMSESGTHAPIATKDSLQSLMERLDEKPSDDSAVIPIAYEITIESERDSSVATLRVQMITNNQESLTSSLEISLAKSKGKWRATGWQAK